MSWSDSVLTSLAHQNLLNLGIKPAQLCLLCFSGKFFVKHWKFSSLKKWDALSERDTKEKMNTEQKGKDINEAQGWFSGVPAHGRGIGTKWSLRSLPIQTILWWFCAETRKFETSAFWSLFRQNLLSPSGELTQLPPNFNKVLNTESTVWEWPVWSLWFFSGSPD